MPGESNGKRVAILGGCAVGVFFAIGAWMRFEKPIDSRAAPGANAATSKKHKDSWTPWSIFGGDAATSGKPKLPDLYKGPRIPVTVKVVDGEGKPISGASVEARADADEYEVAGLDDSQYDQLIKQKYPEDAAGPDVPGSDAAGSDGGDDWRPSPRVAVESGRTDRNGIYVAKMKPDVSVIFYASDGVREGIGPTVYVSPPLPGHPNSAGIEVTIEIAEVGTLTGRVTDEHGRGIEGADLRLAAWSAGEVEQDQFVAAEDAAHPPMTTGADGAFRIPLRTAGAFDLEVNAKGYQPVIRQAVQVLPGRETDVSITLAPSSEITGIVLDGSGKPVAGARVIVQGDARGARALPAAQSEPGAPGAPSSLSVPVAPPSQGAPVAPPSQGAPVAPPSQGAPVASTETSTGEDGRFVADELAPGRFTVAASAEGFRPAEVWEVEAGGPPVTVRLTAGARIHGIVTVSQELLRALPQESVVTEPVDNEGTGGSGVAGSHSIVQGDVYLSAVGEETLSMASGVPKGRANESPSGMLDERGRYFASAAIDEQGHGTFDIEGLPAGTWTATLALGPAVTTLSPVRTWEGGVVEVRAQLPDRGSAIVSGTLRIPDGRLLAEGSAFLYGSLPSGLSAPIDAQGHFTFLSVPPGEYMVHAVGTFDATGDSASNAFAPARKVSVPASGNVSVELAAQVGNPGGWTETPSTLPDETAIPGDDEVASGGENPVEPSADDGWSPDIGIEQIDGSLVVTWAPPQPGGKRLFGGDRITQIDGASVSGMESWQALELLYGKKGSICTLSANRPATNESISAALPRVRPPDAYESRHLD